MLNERGKVILEWRIRPVANRELYSWREQVLIQYTQSLTDARILYKYQADPQPSPRHHVTTRCMCWESSTKIFLRATNNLQKSHLCLAYSGLPTPGRRHEERSPQQDKKKRKRSPSFIWEALIIFTLLRSTMPRFCSHFGTNSPQIVMLINPHIFHAVRKKTLNLGMNSKRQIYGRRHYCEMWSFKNLTRLSLCG